MSYLIIFFALVIKYSSGSLLRQALFEDTGEMYPELITRPDIKVMTDHFDSALAKRSTEDNAGDTLKAVDPLLAL